MDVDKMSVVIDVAAIGDDSNSGEEEYEKTKYPNRFKIELLFTCSANSWTFFPLWQLSKG